MENPPKNFFRMTIGKEVRLKYAYIVQCTSVDKDEQGNITAIHCQYLPETKSGMAESNRKVKGTIHWVSAAHCKEAEVRLFDRLFAVPDPDNVEEGHTFLENLNPDSLKTQTAYIEPQLLDTTPLAKYQFERIGYFCIDKDSTEDKLVFNRTVALKDSWAKGK